MSNIDLSKFSVNSRDGEYQVTFDVRGTMSVTIKAGSDEEARKQAHAMMEDDDFGLELDEVDDISIFYLRKSCPLYRVLRDGKKSQVSFVRPGDEPREPDEHGF